jgi:hypothetical protein
MNPYFLLFVFLTLSSTFVYGQSNKLIYPKQISNEAERSSEILQTGTAFVSVDFVGINLEKVLSGEQFTLQFGEKNLSIVKKQVSVRGINNFLFVGNNNKGDRVIMSVLDNDVQGVIETAGAIFSIKTIGESEYVVVKVDQSKLREKCENIPDMSNHLKNDGNGNRELNGDIDINNRDVSPIPETRATPDCKIRILVLYTSNAQMLTSGNIRNIVLYAVALTNISFIESGIDSYVELAYIGRTNYTESGDIGTDLSRFRNAGDGYMEEVHALRNKYSADVCILLTYDPNWCGMASGIGVPASHAFSVVSTFSNCATTNYSFAHEIGHLLGCRHDPFVDNSITPFAYGHGYVSPSNSNRWRTIMAYRDACGGCQRILNWSNPNVTYADGTPMGTTSRSNNARVWNEQSNYVMTFRQPENNIIVTNSDVVNSTFGDIVAKQNITTSGVVNIKSGSNVSMRAGNSITIQAGFTVESGATFSAIIENVGDCGSRTSSAE